MGFSPGESGCHGVSGDPIGWAILSILQWVCSTLVVCAKSTQGLQVASFSWPDNVCIVDLPEKSHNLHRIQDASQHKHDRLHPDTALCDPVDEIGDSFLLGFV